MNDFLPPQTIFDGVGKLQATFTAAVTDVITAVGHGLKNDKIVQLTTSVTLPSGLATTTTYYIVEATADTFKLALTPGGTAIDITDTGTGIHTFNLKGHAVLVRGFRHVEIHYTGTGTSVSTVKIQRSNQENMPAFEDTASDTNKWDYVQIVDLENAVALDGDVGIAVIANEVGKRFEVNDNGAVWLCANITAFTSGNISITVTCSNS